MEEERVALLASDSVAVERWHTPKHLLYNSERFQFEVATLGSADADNVRNGVAYRAANGGLSTYRDAPVAADISQKGGKRELK